MNDLDKKDYYFRFRSQEDGIMYLQKSEYIYRTCGDYMFSRSILTRLTDLETITITDANRLDTELLRPVFGSLSLLSEDEYVCIKNSYSRKGALA